MPGLVAERRTTIPASATPAQAAAALRAAVAAERARVLREQAARSGGVEPELLGVWLDGRRDTGSLAGATARSVVVLDWSYMREACARAYELLFRTGPEDDGEWKAGLRFLVDGVETPPGGLPPGATEATLLPTVPYARRLEVSPGFAVDVETHFVAHAAAELQRRHADLATYGFGFVRLEGPQYRLWAPIRTRSRRIREGTTAQPAIGIKELSIR